jgi:hypothetical protein
MQTEEGSLLRIEDMTDLPELIFSTRLEPKGEDREEMLDVLTQIFTVLVEADLTDLRDQIVHIRGGHGVSFFFRGGTLILLSSVWRKATTSCEGTVLV